MKINALVIVVLSLVSCGKSNNKYMEAINQNNVFLQDEITIYNARFYMKSQEQPYLYDSIICKKLNNLLNEISSLKNYEDYKFILSKMKKFVTNQKLNIKFDSITTTEKTILKNKLFLNLANINKSLYYKKSIVISDISFVPYIKNEVKSDTLILNFFNHNQYVVTTDSIVDGKDKIIHFKSAKKSNIWQIKYKPKSSKSTYYGKIFEVDTDGNTKLIKNIKHTITK
jgi:hypothetical protein